MAMQKFSNMAAWLAWLDGMDGCSQNRNKNLDCHAALRKMHTLTRTHTPKQICATSATTWKRDAKIALQNGNNNCKTKTVGVFCVGVRGHGFFRTPVTQRKQQNLCLCPPSPV